MKHISPNKGRKLSEETKALMSLRYSGENNPLFGKTHSEKTKNLIRIKALGRKPSNQTLLKLSSLRGSPVYIYAKSEFNPFLRVGSNLSYYRDRRKRRY